MRNLEIAAARGRQEISARFRKENSPPAKSSPAVCLYDVGSMGLQSFNGPTRTMHGKIFCEKMFCRLTLLAALFSWAAATAVCQDRAPVAQFSVRWQNLPWGEAVDRLRNVTGSAIFVDRRTDPRQPVNFAVSDAIIGEILANLASSAGLGYVELDGLHYLGPPATAEGLSTVATAHRREAAALDPELRKNLLSRRRLVWPRLTEPRGLIEQLVEQHGWRLSNPEAIPHDLWGAGELPSMPLVDQLTVLLAGFDLTFQFRPESRTIVLQPIQWNPRKSTHAARPTSPRKTSRSRIPSKQVFTLRVENQPVGRVLAQLATRLDWKLEIDEAAIRGGGRSLDSLVSFEVKNASEQELLDALLTPAGLAATTVGDRLRIAPK